MASRIGSGAQRGGSMARHSVAAHCRALRRAASTRAWRSHGLWRAYARGSAVCTAHPLSMLFAPYYLQLIAPRARNIKRMRAPRLYAHSARMPLRENRLNRAGKHCCAWRIHSNQHGENYIRIGGLMPPTYCWHYANRLRAGIRRQAYNHKRHQSNKIRAAREEKYRRRRQSIGRRRARALHAAAASVYRQHGERGKMWHRSLATHQRHRQEKSAPTHRATHS